MNIDTDRIDDAALALMLLGLHAERRVWKLSDLNTMRRLHTKGLISNPDTQAKSVLLTDEGLIRAKAVYCSLFSARASTEDTEQYDARAPEPANRRHRRFGGSIAPHFHTSL